MTIHILVEGPSERAFLEPWTRRFLRNEHVRVHPHQGKGKLPDDLDAPPDSRNRSLLHQLPAKLRAFASAPDSGELGVVILVDADQDDCEELASTLRKAVARVAGRLQVMVRIAVEEIEAFYLGDLHALKAAFPDADMRLARKYVPDSICNTWELFGQVVGDGGGNKVAWAEAMGAKVTTLPSKNRSPSFRALCRALKRLVPKKAAPKRPKKRRHVARTHPARRRA